MKTTFETTEPRIFDSIHTTNKAMSSNNTKIYNTTLFSMKNRKKAAK